MIGLSESQIVHDIRVALGTRHGCAIWRNQVGVATYARGRRIYTVPYGLCPGSSDLIGIVDGRFLAIEVKTAKGRLSKEQEMFLKVVARLGGISGTARNVEEAINLVKNGELQCE